MKGRKQTPLFQSGEKKKTLLHSSQRDTHRQWHAHSITNQHGDKGLLHYWLRSCSSNKAIHRGDSVTARYGAEMDANGFTDSDVENWTVDPPTDEYEAPIFPIICHGQKWSISFWDRAGPLRRMESNKAFKWNNYLNVALHQLPCSRFVRAPVGPIEMCRVDFCVRWRRTTTHLTIWNKQITVVNCLWRRRESALQSHSWCFTLHSREAVVSRLRVPVVAATLAVPGGH